MAHEFVLLVKGELKTYTNYKDIPDEFNNLIKFLPEIPEPPHTHEQHEELDLWNERLKELLKRETNGN
jgi:hypothetical protein